MDHWLFQPELTSGSDVVNSVGQQQFGVSAGTIANASQGVFYVQTVNGKLHLCAHLSAFQMPTNANITPAGSMQSGIHVPIRVPK